MHVQVRLAAAPRPLKHVAQYSVNARATGVLRHVRFLEAWRWHPDVVYARPLVQVRLCTLGSRAGCFAREPPVSCARAPAGVAPQPGHVCVCAADGLPTMVCDVMVAKPTVR